MAEYQGTTGFQGSWEETYRQTPPEELPWNAGMADGDLKHLVETLGLEPGKAYDLGCGPGNDAVFLAQEGWKVTAVDISPTALQLARQTAAKAGLEGKIQFVAADVLTLKGMEDSSLVNDRGCFHTLPSQYWADYVKMAAGLLRKKGLLALKVFSFKEPQQTTGPGPYRFTAEELESVFENDFEMVMLKEGVFHGPRKPYSLFGVFRKQ